MVLAAPYLGVAKPFPELSSRANLSRNDRIMIMIIGRFGIQRGHVTRQLVMAD
jgi:hypothetical protein